MEDIPGEKVHSYKNRMDQNGEARLHSKIPTAKPTFLNPKNTFKNFVIGAGNQLAHAASIAVANAPGRAYNLSLFTGIPDWVKRT